MIPIPVPSYKASPADLEQPACPLCGSENRRASVYGFPPFAVARCRRCGLWYLCPRLAEPIMQRSYMEDGYFEGGEGGYSSYQAQEPTLRPTFRRFLAELRRRGVAGGQLLEVGCAYGFFLDEAKDFFAHRTGTDYSPAALKKARGRADRLILGGTGELGSGELFDCIACIHVIEHIYDPVGFLRTLAGHLRPGGWIVLATPDMGSLWRTLMRHRWPFFKIPEHVTFFDRSTLRELLHRSGLAEVQSLPYASVFSLDLVGEKLNLRLPAFLNDRRLWLPATTIAAGGRKPEGDQTRS
ncbi:MAG TPA: class I SAM-dependent methyltransferase [Thermoanaerobaculia bacterium]|jgi:SAM-dependent methyltransferase|nr:class I SAM-dependent methyltransferase [Thermoanaerobaculia bacterium]